jgi:uncharacterized delta-60 repeat protein
MPARFSTKLAITLTATALLLAIASPAAAPPGDLDPTFDGDGKVRTDFIQGLDISNAVAVQADGRVVAAGRAGPPPNAGPSDFALARYNSNGSLDPTFDGDGKVTTDFGGGGDEARAVAIQGDGKIVAAGSGVFGSLALARYNADGSLDPTFDGDGRVTTSGLGAGLALAIQGDGKIVAAGFGGGDFTLARYNPDGSLDPTFDGDGMVTTDFAGSTDRANALAIRGDGRIVAAGFALVSGTDDFAVARYNSDGSLDPTFDGDGKVTTDFGGTVDQARAVAIQGDGKIVAVGCTDCSGDPGISVFALARYNAEGSLDTTFDADGKVTTDFPHEIFPGRDAAFGAVIQRDGRIVAVGCADCFTAASDFALTRYRTDGSLDPNFSGDGKVRTDFVGVRDIAFAVTIQGDGKVVAAGCTWCNTTSADFALARYTVCRRSSRPSSIPFCP